MVDGPAVPAPPEGRVGEGVEEALSQNLRQAFETAEVGVVTLSFPRHGGVDRVVAVVTPLGGEAVSAVSAGGDEFGIVQVALRDQGQRPADPV